VKCSEIANCGNTQNVSRHCMTTHKHADNYERK
jgi:hypothetical protein